ncbi:PhzF family phenazine biosynthesis protein [Mariniflexile gromovii]|uniref:PhzF family phenazine biosynthesis protein n=1 Tax=Mariniflexile gromovii TaxID=362523 RepID=A0ABS4BZ78_9FLAO|nr:PhzF family phenazine biosynthesis protein [Mariniflexile gromovii]MBP0905874.1 PhzF family phenazine biosynthesis protein [Mariniflexile gromovii]
MTKIETYIVDSFTDKPFKGNPAGVCLLDQKMTDEQMLSIAKELGLSETAFITLVDKPNKYSIRYFSPVMEIPLCGHATLASSKVLFEINTELNHIHFKNIQGLDLMIKKNQEKIEMEFPVYNTIPQNTPKELLNALGIEKISNSVFNKETSILLIEIESCQLLNNLTPNFEKLKASHNSINGVLVTAISDKNDFDFESRYFWPWSGTNEDPVTGGTHTFLAKYWAERLNKKKMNSFQCSERTGFMEVELISDSKLTIKSEAQIILKGELRI